MVVPEAGSAGAPGSISVAVATCGRPDSLARCLKAIARQTVVPSEVIVVEQAPSAASLEVVATCGLPNLRYFEQEKLGLSASRNAALLHAGSQLLAVTDDDCAPEPGWLAAMLEAFAGIDRIAACTGAIHPPPGDPPPGMYGLSSRTSPVPRLFAERAVPWVVGSGGNFAARVAELRAIGGWDERLGTGSPGKAGEDCDVIDRILAHGGAIRYEASAVVRHDFQSRARRKETRSTYAFGIGAMCGLRLARRDRFGWAMLRNYVRVHLRGLARALRGRLWEDAAERIASLRAILPGLRYGLRVPASAPRAGAARAVALACGPPTG